MATSGPDRRLAAILAADLVGYSRLREANEERTMLALKRHRREVFDQTIARHGGCSFKVMGDGFLVVFGSVLNATSCAIEIQRGMPERNEGVPEDRPVRFRIGTNLCDLIVVRDAGESVGEPGVAIDGVRLGRFDQGLGNGGSLATGFAADEEGVLSGARWHRRAACFDLGLRGQGAARCLTRIMPPLYEVLFGSLNLTEPKQMR